MTTPRAPLKSGLSIDGVEDDCGVCDSLGSFKKQMGSIQKGFSMQPPSHPKKPAQPTQPAKDIPMEQDSTSWPMRAAPDISEIGNSGWFVMSSNALLR
jgi:hypothetical protein